MLFYEPTFRRHFNLCTDLDAMFQILLPENSICFRKRTSCNFFLICGKFT